VLCDEQGRPRADALDCLALIKEHGAVIGTGHLAPEESIALLVEAADMGLQNIVLTHPSENVTPVPIELQKQAVEVGALIEHCLLAVSLGNLSWQELAGQIRAVGVDHCFLTSDYGQPDNGPVVAAFASGLEKLRACGFSDEEMRRMIVDNPRKLVGERL
jgi:predicted metal-dependent phosphotriesterase family hydrolase